MEGTPAIDTATLEYQIARLTAPPPTGIPCECETDCDCETDITLAPTAHGSPDCFRTALGNVITGIADALKGLDQS